MSLLGTDLQSLIEIARIVVPAITALAGVGRFAIWYAEQRLYQIRATVDGSGLIETKIRTRTDKALELNDFTAICYRGRFWKFWRWMVGHSAARGHQQIPGFRRLSKLPVVFDKAQEKSFLSTIPADRALKLVPVDPGVAGQPRRQLEDGELYVLLSIAGRTVIRPVYRASGHIVTIEEMAARTAGEGTDR